ncbi:MAG: 4a-hydroxytetrahydrobiopterin dehydratase [Phycicoccus sp.]|nr:4a-hydroxytetrahydrobiopterin dehydratase [Phycicoccus sp.]
MTRRLDPDEISRQLLELPDWTCGGDGDAIEATFAAPDFLTAIRLVAEAADVAEEMNHHPDIDIRWRITHWLLTTHDVGGLSQLDIEQAHRISALARQFNAVSAR